MRPLPAGHVERITGTGSRHERFYPLTQSQESLQVQRSVERAKDEGTLGRTGIGGEVADDYVPD